MDIQKDFRVQFLGVVGRIEGGDGALVEVVSLSVSWESTTTRKQEFGCKEDERALLVEWIPSESGVESETPEGGLVAVFPGLFKGLPVYYKQGSMAFAC